MKIRYSIACVAMVAMSSVVLAQDSSSGPKSNGSSIEELIAGVAKQTGKKFIVDPRVRGESMLVGLSPNSLDYAKLLSVLELQGYAAVEVNNVVRVVPDTNVRSHPVPTVAGNKQYADSEVVTRVIPVKSIQATQLLPMLRPMLPQYAHFAASACPNMFLIVDRYANVQRIVGLIEAMDKGEPIKPKCEEPKN